MKRGVDVQSTEGRMMTTTQHSGLNAAADPTICSRWRDCPADGCVAYRQQTEETIEGLRKGGPWTMTPAPDQWTVRPGTVGYRLYFGDKHVFSIIADIPTPDYLQIRLGSLAEKVAELLTTANVKVPTGSPTRVLTQLHELLWPEDNPDRAWDSDTMQEVADLLTNAGYGG